MLEDFEIIKALDCIYNIFDRLDGMKHEFLSKNPSAGYLQEKIKPALHDMNVLNEIIKKMD